LTILDKIIGRICLRPLTREQQQIIVQWSVRHGTMVGYALLDAVARKADVRAMIAKMRTC
jgi:hypothetical protein